MCCSPWGHKESDAIEWLNWLTDWPTSVFLGFFCGSAGKESTCNGEDLGSIPGLGRSPGEREGYPLQYSGLKNSMDSIVHGVAKSPTFDWATFTFTSIWRTDAEAEAPILWLPDVKNSLIRNKPDAGKYWRQEEQGTIDDDMVGWHHQLSGHKSEQTLEDSGGQGNLACCSPWGPKSWTQLSD